MSYTVAIRKNETGEVRTASYDFDFNLFWWTDGNFACDCNRYLEFERAGGHEPTDDEDDRLGGCGHERYTVLYADLVDGNRVTVDDVGPNPPA